MPGGVTGKAREGIPMSILGSEDENQVQKKIKKLHFFLRASNKMQPFQYPCIIYNS